MRATQVELKTIKSAMYAEKKLEFSKDIKHFTYSFPANHVGKLLR